MTDHQKKHAAEREIARRRRAGEDDPRCISCHRRINPPESVFAQSRSKKYIFLCADCARKEGLIS